MASGKITAALPEMYLADANNVEHGSTGIYHYDYATLNTAYKQGAAASSEGIIISSSQPSSTWGIQLSLGYGEGAIFCRILAGGAWYNWSKITTI